MRPATIRIEGERKRKARRRPVRAANIALLAFLFIALFASVHMAWSRWQAINHQAQLEARI